MVSRTMTRFDSHHKHPTACLHAVGPDASSTRTLLLSLSTIAGTKIRIRPGSIFNRRGQFSISANTFARKISIAKDFETNRSLADL